MGVIKKQFFDVNGRIGRLDYLIRLIVASVTFGVLFFVNIMLISVHQTPPISVALSWVIIAASCIVSLVLMAKRLHDVNKTGWLALLLFVPVVGFILFLVMLFMPGSEDANNFGGAKSG